MYPLYNYSMQVLYSGNGNLPVKAVSSWRALTASYYSLPTNLVDSTEQYFFFDAQNRKIKDSVMNRHFDINTSAFINKAVYVANYAYSAGMITSKAQEQLNSAPVNQVLDTALLDDAGNIRRIISRQHNLHTAYNMAFDGMNNPYEKCRNFCLLIPRMNNPNPRDEFNFYIGKANTKAYDVTSTGLGAWAGMIACGGGLYNFQYNPAMYPSKMAATYGYTMQFTYKLI
jgi:hypothetical protein